jgi:hypothetical protein
MMERTTEQFIGIFPNAIHEELCSDIVSLFDSISEHGLTMSSMQEIGGLPFTRKDEVVNVPSGLSLMQDCFHKDITIPLWQNIEICLNLYFEDYNINQLITSSAFRVHRVQPTGGYHAWHHEHAFDFPWRVLVWMIVIEAPKRGGETEFLYQSMRVEPKVGQLLIWPAGFTHKHRGNPPLEGQKTYITGWFSLVPPPQQ